MSEKRANPRTSLLDFQPILDADSGKVVGYLGDVSAEGIKLLSKKRVPRDRRLRLRLHYVTFGGGAESLEVEADPVWESVEEGQAFVETGLRIQAPSAEQLAVIERIVADLAERP